MIAAGVGVLLLAAYLVYSRRAGASGSGVDTSGSPGPDLTGSAAQQPSGGASSIPGQLPDAILTSPDALTQQVQAAEAPQQNASTGAATTSAGGFAPTSTGAAPLGTAYITPSPGYFTVETDPYASSGVPHDTVVSTSPSITSSSNVRKPGAQI